MEWIRSILLDRICGKNIHIEPITALEKITSTYSNKIPYQGGRTVGELLFHMNWWQDFSLGLIRGVIGAYEEGVDWPTGDVDWDELVERFVVGIGKLGVIAENRDLNDIVVISDGIVTTVGAEVLGVSQHNSYHLGQIVSACRALGVWK